MAFLPAIRAESLRAFASAEFDHASASRATILHSTDGPFGLFCDRIDSPPQLTPIDVVAGFVGLLGAMTLAARCRRVSR